MSVLPKDIEPQSFAEIILHSFSRGRKIFLLQLPFLLVFLIPLTYGQVLVYKELKLSENQLVFYDSLLHLGLYFFAVIYYVYIVHLFLSKEGHRFKAQFVSIKKVLIATPGIIMATVLYYVAILFGMILLVIPGVLFFVWFSLYPQIIAFEKKGMVDSLKRSLALVKGAFFRVLCIILFFMALRMIVYLLANSLAFNLIYADVLIPSLIELVILPFEATAYFLLYLELRSRKEAFDYEEFKDRMIESN